MWAQSLLKYDKHSVVDPWDLAALYYYAESGEEEGIARIIDLDRITTLTHTDQQHVSSFATIVSLARASDSFRRYSFEYVPPRHVPTTVIVDDDDVILEYFPLRTKNDGNIRRSRMYDVFQMYIERGMKHDLYYNLTQLSNLDYICVMNILFACTVHGQEWFDNLAKIGAFNSLTSFTAWAAGLNVATKKYDVPMDMRLKYAELGNLTGYRMLPFAEFDPVRETEKLAQGGEPHGLITDDWMRIFEYCAEEVMRDTYVRDVEWISLDEFIKSGKSDTSGASSFGTVRYVDGDKTFKFKARKNLVLDVLSLDNILEETYKTLDRQIASAFVKEEPGKLRIAVTGNTGPYYGMDWLNYLSAHCYKSWKMNTLELGRKTEIRAMDDVVAALDESWSLPFDFHAFDHQPTTDEIVKLVEMFVQFCYKNVPRSELDGFIKLVARIVDSFRHAVCTIWHNGLKYVFEVTGGLQSGIRWTSLIGNMWNMVMSTRARKMLLHAAGSIKVIKIRGDDSSVIAKTYAVCLLMNFAYKAINARGAEGKYGIHYQQTEFLRVWYTNRRLYGYPNRSLIGVTQRKPWNSVPWTSDAVIADILTALGTTERRCGLDLSLQRDVICKRWAMKRGVDSGYLSLPLGLGGLGLTSWEGKFCKTKYPRVSKVGIRFLVPAGTFVRYKEKYDYELSDQVLKEIQQDQMLSKTTADDVPGVGRILRDKFDELLTEFKLKPHVWRNFSGPIVQLGRIVQFLAFVRSITVVESLDVVDGLVPDYYGSFRSEQQAYLDHQYVSKFVDLPRYDNPSLFSEAKRLEKRLKISRTVALDILFGSYSPSATLTVHPLMAETVVNLVLMCFTQVEISSRMNYYWIEAYATKEAEDAVQASPLYNRLFMW